MSAWRPEALKYLPQQKELIEKADTISFLLSELWWEFKDAYQHASKDEKIVAGVYDFAAWCWHGSDFRGNNIRLITEVFGQFYERLPQDPEMRYDMSRWLCLEEFEVLQVGPFTYFLNPDEHLAMVKEFRNAKAQGLFPSPKRCERLKHLAISTSKF